MNNKYIDDLINLFIKNALNEDIGEGDHTSLSCIPQNTLGKANLLIKESGIISGIRIAKMVFKEFDASLKVTTFIKDGDFVNIGDIAFSVEGKRTSILQTERLALNILQRMSGIATNTNSYVKLLEGLNTKILDTRKTTPGMRILEKEAVRTGGGENHRMGLYDMIMIKDNHIDFAGGIEEAITKTKIYLKENNLNLKIEVEARSIDEVMQSMTNKHYG